MNKEIEGGFIMNSVWCYDENSSIIGEYCAPFDVDVDCYQVSVSGKEFGGMMLRGRCNLLSFVNIMNYNNVDLSGFMDLEIGKVVVVNSDKGLLKLLELNCKKVVCNNKKLRDIVNKYLSEPDPLMRDIQGCKYELAINGYKDKL